MPSRERRAFGEAEEIMSTDEERDAGLLDLGGPSLLVPPLRFVTERSVDRAFAAGTMLQIALYAPLLSLFVEPLALLVNE